MNPELRQQLLASERRTKRNFIIVEGVLLLLILMLGAAIFTDPVITRGTQIALTFFGLGVLVLMVLLAKLIVQHNPLVEILENDPRQIQTVEILSIVYPHGQPTRQMNLHFILKNNRRIVLSDRRTAVEALLPHLKNQLPHASFTNATQR